MSINKGYAAAIALEIVDRLHKAGCTLPYVRMFCDGSGRFVVYEADRDLAERIINVYLQGFGTEWGYCLPEAERRGRVGFTFTRHGLLTFRDEEWGPPMKDES